MVSDFLDDWLMLLDSFISMNSFNQTQNKSLKRVVTIFHYCMCSSNWLLVIPISIVLLSFCFIYYRILIIIIWFYLQVFASGTFELQILEISNTNNHLLSGYCCGVPLSIRSTKTTGCPQCATAFRLCLKEYQQSTTQTQSGILNGCSFGNVTSSIIGGSSFVLSDLVGKAGSLVLPFTFRWTVSFSSFYSLFTLIYSIHICFKSEKTYISFEIYLKKSLTPLIQHITQQHFD